MARLLYYDGHVLAGMLQVWRCRLLVFLPGFSPSVGFQWGNRLLHVAYPASHPTHSRVNPLTLNLATLLLTPERVASGLRHLIQRNRLQKRAFSVFGLGFGQLGTGQDDWGSGSQNLPQIQPSTTILNPNLPNPKAPSSSSKNPKPNCKHPTRL